MRSRNLKGVGEHRAAYSADWVCDGGGNLAHAMCPTVYEDASTVSPIATLSIGMDATIVAR